ncbi:MAG: SiaB family protein kinase [Bacteroidales bacterium]|nr:SiaB family protein kinase [Bacteroidales bacterium]
MSDQSVTNQDKASFLDDFYEMLTNEIVIAYRGTFEKSILGVLAQNIESSVHESTVLKKKFFKLFLELAQNIASHSVEISSTADGEDSGVGLLIIKHKGANYLFITGNLIENEQFSEIKKIIDKINNLNREELRKLKRTHFELAEKGEKNYLGLIQIALVSGHKLEIAKQKAGNDQLFLIISAELSKEY